MVRNSELPEIGHTAKSMADFVRRLIDQKNMTQEEVGTIIDRAQSYASLRIKGLKSWTIDELDVLAPHLGYVDGLDLMLASKNEETPADAPSVEERYRALHASDLKLAAKKGDIDAEQQAMEEMP
jgi:predicted XRE-type DNA-binding protein